MEPDGQLRFGFVDASETSPVRDAAATPATAAWQAQAWRAAESWFERGCALDSDRATYAEAIDAYERAIEAAPEFADAYCNLGSVYFNQGRRTPARESFERALAIDATHLEANLNLATLEEEVGHDAAALRYYRAALESDPLHADTHVSVALLYEKLRALAKAMQHWRRYLQLDPAGLWADIARRHIAE
jgi:tetratricopeptide (TPR) repeat protein